MTVSRIRRYCAVTALVTLAAGFALNNAIAAASPADGQQGVEVLTRGPVHEAFAETVTFDPEPGIVAPKSPPAAIEELPPDQKPEGAHVAWIPGYWAWDDERNDFLWVSGIWRALPPDRQWVPGYWGQSEKGFQWTSGYWADAKASEVEYLPEPPATAEAGPNTAALSPGQTWMPGCWVWQQGRYVWSPGYWADAQPDWDWVPAHYVWAPRGYVYVDGYWDYSVNRRGVLFAPVFFDPNVYAQQGFSYSPAVVINPAVFASQLFLRPNYQHYYFGDYYDSTYSTAGFYPWFSYNSSRFGYDPIYAQQLSQHRQDPTWARTLQADFQNRVDHQNLRPPRTWAAQQALVASQAKSTQKSFVIAAPLDQVTKSKDSPYRFQPIDQTARQQLGQQAQGVHKFREERQKLETKAPANLADTTSKQLEPARVKLPKSPIVAKSPDQLEKAYVPPKAHVAPPPDPKVEPKLRVTQSTDHSQPYTVNKLPQTDGQTQGKPQGGPQAMPPGAPTGNAPGAPKDNSKGQPKGNSQGQTQGQPQGGPQGNPPGASTGNLPGAAKDNSKGQPKGNPQGQTQGQPQGGPPGNPPGAPTGNAPGAATDNSKGQPKK
jgi:hypothetical protein